MNRTINVKLSCFAPDIQMIINVPAERDAEEYIDELLEAILNDEFRFNCKWDFA